MDVICYVEFFDTMTNKMKNDKINDYYIRYPISRRIYASNNRYAGNKVNKLNIVIEGEIKNMLKTLI